MLDYMVRNWWALAARGALAILFGFVAVLWPGLTVLALAVAFGAYALADGLLAGWSALRAAKPDRPPLVLEAVLGVLLGILALTWPALTVFLLSLIIGLWAVVTGAFEIAAAVRLSKQLSGEWLFIFAGVLSVAFGLVMWVAPIAGALGLAFVVGVYAIVFGAALVVLSLRLRLVRAEHGGRLDALRAPEAAGTHDTSGTAADRDRPEQGHPEDPQGRERTGRPGRRDEPGAPGAGDGA
ncbi:HdeD family acid-resistance protein [Streptomonospora nanhaiensis]|uniref:Uncharacterized membrane protein HdeD (DUF308 family) n=1 Tax=Streptomonospora nanhaiensis TaxID=1323731 RepID=A0A853BPR0_9ACTN|nr:HdeD family acid-resistance protein [Streptomonospora nanhaiensis]MBV2365157.1 HdeD family acid-resistance protein [Streptomonospora nanhaiensis]MBV2366338.1 HdeD family acid-resistance protein [Streptomonospora nanhaiensis]MBX9391904.1 HdeD family acid-resistance protein [Streptomonospora nanhaiensis]NYI97428.1 uncharacterized membrane protein HdeD (DUF308 family) [Streptomonospora nanhaiensis]